MKFSKDTSRLVEGRTYWSVGTEGGVPSIVTFEAYDRTDTNWLWGDEVPVPTVEVEPERPAAPELLPCPFCGGTDLEVLSSHVACEDCGADGPWCEHAPEGEGVAAWNTRAAPPAPEPPSKPERPAWTPPVCPAGQAYLVSDSGSRIAIAVCDTPLLGLSYLKPSWPPRIGEHINFHYGDEGEWAHVPCLSSPMKDGRGRWYVLVPNGRAYQDDEGVTWRWVYRDLSDYTPPGGE